MENTAVLTGNGRKQSHFETAITAVLHDKSAGGGALQLNNAAGYRSRGPLESSISSPNVDPLARRAADKLHVAWGPKKKRNVEKSVAVRFEGGCDGKPGRDVEGFK